MINRLSQLALKRSDIIIRGWRKQWFDAKLVLRLERQAVKRFGFIRAIRETRQYLRDKKGFFFGMTNRYIRKEKDIYLVPNLPPLNRSEFLDYILDDMEALNHSKKTPLVFALVSVSSRCPYHCKYCYTFKDLQHHEVLPLPVLIKTIQRIIEHGIHNILLTGGEPMMRWEELFQLLDSCKYNKTNFWIVSTGWEMDKTKLETLRSNGLRGVMISLDSVDEATCIRYKGHPDTFKTAVNAISNAKKAGLIVCVNCVVGRELLERSKFDEFVRFAGELGAQYINCFSPRPIKGTYTPEPFSIMELKKLAVLINNSQKEKQYLNMPVVYSADVWEAVRGCIGGKGFIYITPAGDVTSCPFIQDVRGNIMKDDIDEILKDIRDRETKHTCIVNKRFAGALAEKWPHIFR